MHVSKNHLPASNKRSVLVNLDQNYDVHQRDHKRTKPMSRIPDNLQDAPKNLTIAARNAQKEKERIKASKSRISAIRTKMQPQEALASSTNSRQSSMMSIGTKTKYHYVKSKIDSFNNDDLASSKATYYDQENSRRDSHHSSRKCDSSLYSTETTKIIDGNVESEMIIDELQPIKKKILREKKPTTTVLVKSITSKIKTNLVSSIALSRNHIAQEMTQLPKLKSPTYSKPIRDPNILLASEYEDEIFTHIRSVEREMIPNASYMDLQPSLDWDCRKKLLAWIIQVHSQYKLHQETLFITANLIDRFLSLKQVNTDKLQLAGVTCLLIGSKYEEIMSPTVSDLVYMTDNAYEKEEILVAERFILGVLSFKLCYPHPLNFIRRLSKIDNCSKVVRNLAKYFCQITLLEQGFLGCSSSLIGTAAYYLSIKTEKHIKDSGYQEGDLLNCAYGILETLKKTIVDSDYKIVYQQFASEKMGQVAVAMLNFMKEKRLLE